MENKFEIGNLVILKSGSPLMTVYEVSRNNVSCVWFRDGLPQFSNFLSEVLELSE